MTVENPGSGSEPGNPAGNAPPAGQEPAPAPLAPWTDALPTDLKGYALNKGWDAPDKALIGYRELEKFVGAEKAGRGLILPGENATPEELAAFHSKLGVPGDVTGYDFKLPDNFPDPEFGKVAGPLMLKHNIPKSAAQGLIADFAAQVTAEHAAAEAAQTKAFQLEEAAIKDAWGGDFDRNMEIAKRGAARLGFSDDVIDKLEKDAGYGVTLKALHAAGMALGEGRFVEAGAGSPVGEATIEQLQAQRQAMIAEPGFANLHAAKDPETVRRYNEINAKIKAHVDRVASRTP